MVADREGKELAKQFIAETCQKEGIVPGQLNIHMDRGAAMIAKPLAFLLADLGVTKTHSRPHTSDDNPFSESHFKTLKYRPDFPDRFGSQQDARSFCQQFFTWYNTEHHHSGLGLLTPDVATLSTNVHTKRGVLKIATPCFWWEYTSYPAHSAHMFGALPGDRHRWPGRPGSLGRKT